MGDDTYVFVYGTLRREGLPRAKLSGYRRAQLPNDSYYYAVLDKDSSIDGQLWSIPNTSEALAEFDGCEGAVDPTNILSEENLYYRIERWVDVLMDGVEPFQVKAWVYVGGIRLLHAAAEMLWHQAEEEACSLENIKTKNAKATLYEVKAILERGADYDMNNTDIEEALNVIDKWDVKIDHPKPPEWLDLNGKYRSGAQ